MVIKIILGALLLLVMLFLWSCLRISSECSRMEEEYESVIKKEEV